MISKAEIRHFLISTVILGCGIVLWQIIVSGIGIPSYIIPAPLDIMQSLVHSNIRWPVHLYFTLYEVAVGFVVGSFAGIFLAIVMVHSKVLRTILYPYLLFIQLIPKIAIAPIFLIWFGFGMLSKIVITALITFFPMVVETSSGLEAVTPELLMLIRSLRATKWQTFTKVRFTYALPYIFSGMKVSMTLAVIGAIIAEFIAAEKGLGYVIIMATRILQTPEAFVAIAIITFLGISLFAAVSVVERLTIPWYVIPRKEEKLKKV